MTLHYDLIIIGGGAAGLSAAVNAASEGLKVVVLDGGKLGGQAGSSSLIENFMGFPEGISGEVLMRKSIVQAARFGTDFVSPFFVNRIKRIDGIWNVISDDGDLLQARAILVATGVSYRPLMAKNVARFIGHGISYGSPSLSTNYDNKRVVVVGGANSAGQAAVYLAQCSGCEVVLMIRGKSIEDKMSTYLIDKIQAMENITVLTETEIMHVDGGETIEKLVVQSKGNVEELVADHVFVLIGAKPKTAFLSDVVRLDKDGFILTDHHSMAALCVSGEDSGIFVAGDVRSGSVKRVASAVGEGARAVNDIHGFFATATITDKKQEVVL